MSGRSVLPAGNSRSEARCDAYFFGVYGPLDVAAYLDRVGPYHVSRMTRTVLNAIELLRK